MGITVVPLPYRVVEGVKWVNVAKASRTITDTVARAHEVLAIVVTSMAAIKFSVVNRTTVKPWRPIIKYPSSTSSSSNSSNTSKSPLASKWSGGKSQ